MGFKVNCWLLNYSVLLITASLLALDPHRSGAEGLMFMMRPFTPAPAPAPDTLDSSLEDSQVTASSLSAVFSDSTFVGSSSSEKGRRSLSESEDDEDEGLLYIGCYDVWENSTGNYFGSNVQESVMLENCIYLCFFTKVRSSIMYMNSCLSA
jgi:hypothetical protein